ncbi:MAG: HD domain-containing protein [Candidatus Aenigmarchaeota archaeon]|nr:HD domain-containing protein [Candidatus Aenigmarchaeota archaeon]
MVSEYREKILERTDKYYRRMNENDFSHNFDHVTRVERLAKRIGKEERADMEVVEAMCLLFDVARMMEDEGEVEDHSETGSEIARQILDEIGFPKDKVENVCHAILVHRKSKNKVPKTIEAKILQDADYLDAMGAVDVARVISSSIQTKKYRKPMYIDKIVDEPYVGEKSISTIHYFLHKLEHPKLQPCNFHTTLGRKIAEERFRFMKEFTERFIAEWKGEE